jgi:subtilisin family serine protease
MRGPIGGGAHVHDPAADDCCGLDAKVLAARVAAATRSRPTHEHALVVARAPGTPPHPAVAGEALVRLRPGADARAVAARHGLEVRREVPSIGAAPLGIACLARPSGGDPVEVAAALARDEDVLSASPNWVARVALAPPNDALFPLQVGARGIGVLDAWDLSLGDGALVAVLDTGIDGGHRDLAGALAAPGGFVDVVGGAAAPYDDNGHGTAVAGIIAARMNDSGGTAGVAPLSRVLAVKVADREGAASYADIATGLAESVRRGARIVNISLGAPRDDPSLAAAVGATIRAGVLVVAAAGNENIEAPLYPAGYAGVLAVGSSGVRMGGPISSPSAPAGPPPPPELAYTTVLAPSLALLAPGEKVVAPLPGGVHGFVNGTSAAAAHAAGVAALVLAHAPLTSREALERVLRQSAEPVPALEEAAECFPFGRLHARRALDRDAPTYADVAVLGWDLSPREPEAGRAARLRVRVQNQGNAPLGQSVLKAQYYLSTSPIAHEIEPVVVAPLAPGETRVLDVAWTASKMPSSAGAVDVECAFNPAPGETETADNGVRRGVTIVPASASPGQAARDLRIERLEARRDLASAGPLGALHVVIEASVRNVGALDESGVEVHFSADGALVDRVKLSDLPVGGGATMRVTWPLARAAGDLVAFEVNAIARPGETRTDDNRARARLRVGAASTRPVGPLYQQGGDVDLISDAPYRIAQGRPYVPLLLFAPSKADPSTSTFVKFWSIEVTLKNDPFPGTAGTTLFRDATGAPPSVAAAGIEALDEMGAVQPTLDAFRDQELRRNGRHTLLRLPTGLFGLGALPAERYLDVRMDWRFYREVLWWDVNTRSGSNRKMLRVGFADGPLSMLPGDNHYYDAHFHTIAEWYFSGWLQVFAPRKAYGGPLVMAAESAYAIGMLADPRDAKDLLATTDHNAFFNTSVGNPDSDDLRPPFGPTSLAASGGAREFDRYRDLLGLSAGEEVCVEGIQVFGAGPVSVGIPLGSHMVAYRGEHIEGPWHGGGWIPDPSAPTGMLVPLDDTLRTYGTANQGANAEAFAYAAHPFSAGLGWPDGHRRLAFGLDPASRTLDHVHASPPGFVMKGLQLFNGRGARSLPASAIDFDDLNPWVDATWQAGNPAWDGVLGEGLTYWHGAVSELMGYAFVGDPDGVFVRKMFIAGGSDAHGDFNYDISRLATPITFAETFTVGSSPYGSVTTYVFGDGVPGATRGERLMRALSAGRSVATDGPVVSLALDAEGRFDAASLKWHDRDDRAEDDDGRMGGGGAFDGLGTALVAAGNEHVWFRYAWDCARDFGSGDVRAIKVYRDRPGSPNPSVRRGGHDVPVGAGSLAVPPTPGALAAERVDPAEEGLVTAPTAYSIGAFTGGDPDVAPLGVDERRAYSNPVWALPVGVSVAARPSGSGASASIAAGDLAITLTFPVSMDPSGGSVEVKPLDANGETTDGSVAGVALSGTWDRHGGARNARLTLGNTSAISLGGASYPAAGTMTFAAYFRDPPRDLFGNELNRLAFTFAVPLSGGGGGGGGGGGSTAPPTTTGGGAGVSGSGGGGGGCGIVAAGGVAASAHASAALSSWGGLSLAILGAALARIRRRRHESV